MSRGPSSVLTAATSSRVSPNASPGASIGARSPSSRDIDSDCEPRIGRGIRAAGKRKRRGDHRFRKSHGQQRLRGQMGEIAAARQATVLPLELFDREGAAFERAPSVGKMHVCRRLPLERCRLREGEPIRTAAVERNDALRTTFRLPHRRTIRRIVGCQSPSHRVTRPCRWRFQPLLISLHRDGQPFRSHRPTRVARSSHRCARA